MRKQELRHGDYMLRDIRVPSAAAESAVFPPGTLLRRGVAVLALFGVYLISSVWISAQHTRIGYSVYAAMQEKQMLQQKRDYFQLEKLSLMTPSRIETLAKNELGMVNARTDMMIR